MTYPVSVVTSVLNGARTVRQCLESVANQTTPCEHIVVDGGSTDGTAALVRSFRNAILIDAPGTGISEAFNVGITRASGELLGILNADDWYETDAVAKTVQALQACPEAGFSYGNVIVHWGERQILAQPVPPDRLRAACTRLLPFAHISSFVKREVYREHGLYDVGYRVAMDFDFYARIISGGVLGARVDGVIGHVAHGGVSSNTRRFFAEYWEISSHYLGRPRAFLLLARSISRAALYNFVNRSPLARHLMRPRLKAGRFSELT